MGNWTKKRIEADKKLASLLTSNGVELKFDPFLLNLPLKFVKPNDEGMAFFNQVLDYMEDCGLKDEVQLTKRGYIRKGSPFGWIVLAKKKRVSMIALTFVGWFRIDFTSCTQIVKEGGLTGRQSYYMIEKACKKAGIDLKDYYIEDGEAVKETIEKAWISTTRECVLAETYEHAHHIDLHSAYPSGICFYHPEFVKAFEPIYRKRKSGDDQDKRLKLALDAAIGYFQSEYLRWDGNQYCLAQLARDAHKWTNEQIVSITIRLEKAGFKVLAYNTDGIWYAKLDENGNGVPSAPFTDEQDYDGLGGYHTDHVDCQIRWKSKGAYEYIENGKYVPVLRGDTDLDLIKDRKTEWVWGDIFLPSAKIKKYQWDIVTQRIVKVRDDEE